MTSNTNTTGSGIGASEGNVQHPQLYGGSNIPVDVPDHTGKHGQFGEMGEKSASIKDRIVGTLTGHKPAAKDTQRFSPAGVEDEGNLAHGKHDKHRAEEGAIAGAGAGALAGHEHDKHKHDKHHDKHSTEKDALAGSGAGAVAGHEYDKHHKDNRDTLAGTGSTAPLSGREHDRHHRGEEGALAGAGVAGAGVLAGREHERSGNQGHGLTSATGNDVAIGGRAPVTEPIRGDPALQSGGQHGAGLGSSAAATGLGSSTGTGLGSSNKGLGSSTTGTGLGSSHHDTHGHVHEGFDPSKVSAEAKKVEGLVHGHHTTTTGEVLDPHVGQSGKGL